MSPLPRLSPLLIALGLALVGCRSSQTEAAHSWPDLEVRELGSMRQVVHAQGLWFGSAPSEADLELAQRRGIQRVIDLCPRSQQEIASLCANLRLEYIGVPVSAAARDRVALDHVLALLGEDQPPRTLMFCEDGSVCAMLFAIHRVVHQGLPLADALLEARTAGLSGQPQEACVRSEVARRASRPPPP